MTVKENGMRDSEEKQRIELRSEKVRNIIGEIPPALVRWGIAVIAIVVIMLLLAVLCIPYPYGNGETIFRHLME